MKTDRYFLFIYLFWLRGKHYQILVAMLEELSGERLLYSGLLKKNMYNSSIFRYINRFRMNVSFLSATC